VHDELRKQPVQRQASGDPAAERSETVRRLNTQLRKLIEWLPHDADFESNFFCECGCCEPVRLTVAGYDALAGEPVYLAGHTVLEKRYGVTIRQSDG
jgi:hypothetical protein